ncbi:hypothetical protein AQF98_17660 [Pedobacter sp. Hv1]|nr:hypothetical protein AQF98_17660 [Pedobacter sp. Hv1]
MEMSPFKNKKLPKFLGSFLLNNSFYWSIYGVPALRGLPAHRTFLSRFCSSFLLEQARKSLVLIR